jgi:hypothetical protein
MNRISLSKRLSVRVLRALLPLLIASCAHERPTDLRLEQVYRGERNGLSISKVAEAQGFARSVGLIIELSTSEVFPPGTAVSDGFCGERLGLAQLRDGFLYEATEARSKAGPGADVNHGSTRHRYVATTDIVSKPIPPSLEWPDFNLENDHRDICLQTKFGTFYEGQISNVVRVPRALIDQALHSPIRETVPFALIPFPR